MSYYHVRPDFRELDQWLTSMEERTVRSVAASCLTTLARKGRTAAGKNLQNRLDMTRVQILKRIRVARANPKRVPMSSALIVSQWDVREILLPTPRQTGHPGRPRSSNSKAAKLARKRRAQRGAKAPRAGGVKGMGGRFYDHAWIGTARKGGAGEINVLERTPRNTPRVVKRNWTPALHYLTRAQRALAQSWPELFRERLTRALKSRNQDRALQFLQDTGEL